MHTQSSNPDPKPGTDPGPPAYDPQPIRHAAAGGSPLLSLTLSLGLTSLLIYGLSVSLSYPPVLRFIRQEGRRSVSILLQEPTSRPGFTAPARRRFGPEGPGGEGHREGTSTLDPRLAVLSTRTPSMPVEAIDPDELSQDPKADRALLSLNPTLPLQAGGDGLSYGTGGDPARGPGGRSRPPDHRLVPIHQVKLFHRLTPREEAAVAEPVRIRLLIGEDGVPYQASVVSGPAFLRKEALKVALAWRFEPLRPHGLKPPVPVVVTFWPFIAPPP